VSRTAQRATLTLLLVIGVGCSSATSHVEILASIRADAPGPAWNAESLDYRVLERLAFSYGHHVVITPISDASSTERPLLDASIPGLSLTGLNPRQLDDLAVADRKLSESALHALWSRAAGRQRTEIIAATVAAAERFADDPPGTRKILIVLSTGFEQSSVVNMADVSQNLNAETWPVIRRLGKSQMLPQLSGVTVCMASISAGLHGWSDSPEYRRIHRFWHAYFQTAGAALISYGPALPDRCINGT